MGARGGVFPGPDGRRISVIQLKRGIMLPVPWGTVGEPYR